MPVFPIGLTDDIDAFTFQFIQIRIVFHLRNKILKLNMMTANPTNMPNKRLGNFLQIKAAKGAATIPPIASASTMSQRNFSGPIRAKNVAAMAMVMKNSARLTEPTALSGSVPVNTRLGVQMGPHPPPPNASMNAAKNPRALSLPGGYVFIP